jgi:CxxC motif-containing protein (DUF1111 family)
MVLRLISHWRKYSLWKPQFVQNFFRLPMRYNNSIFWLLLLTILACNKGDLNDHATQYDPNSGGSTTVVSSSSVAFGQAAPNLDLTLQLLHTQADGAFETPFVTAPAPVNGGLGPVFNQAACANCHIANGRAPFPEQPQSNPGGLLLRLSRPGANGLGEPLPLELFGGQLQTNAIIGVVSEGQLSIQMLNVLRDFTDGTVVNLRQPIFSIAAPFRPIPAQALMSPRIANPIIGLGLLEAIPEADIIRLADPLDMDQNGITGQANFVWDKRAHKRTVGRFGWKATQPNLYQQTAAALAHDMGVSNHLFPLGNSLDQSTASEEVDEAFVKLAAFYCQSLAVPARRNVEDKAVLAGEALFKALDCAQCHNPTFTTGQHPEYDFLSNQVIHPYTDLLIHDMGEGLADHRPDHLASGRQWRTPPLWGIGLTKIVSGHTNFLHDGRARNLEEAILWHGGEAEQSMQQYLQLSKKERDQLLQFLESL